MTWTLFDERYPKIIPQYEEFLSALEDDLPIGIRINRLKATDQSLIEKIGAEDGLKVLRPFSELDFFEVEGLKKHWGGKLEHHLGLYYIQALSSLLPVYALAPQKGESILDLCSAPGGKSALLAELMELQGPLVCNEPDLNRRRILKANLERMGVSNSAIYAFVGEELPFKEASFDRILLDGPCSSEGTLRKSHLTMKKRKLGNFINYNKGFRVNLQKVQYELLRKAVSLLKPGGTLVYSTCTYDPDENEVQVDRVLKEFPSMSLETITLPEEIQNRLTRGLLSYEGVSFSPSLEKTFRVYPHYLNSIGFYFAKFVKRP